MGLNEATHQRPFTVRWPAVLSISALTCALLVTSSRAKVPAPKLGNLLPLHMSAKSNCIATVAPLYKLYKGAMDTKNTWNETPVAFAKDKGYVHQEHPSYREFARGH